MKRFFWILIALLLFWTALGNFIFRTYQLRETLEQTRQKLLLVVSNAALLIDVSALLQVPLEPTGDSSEAYRIVFNQLETIKQTNPSLKYAYILMTTDKPGILQYVVDADPAPQIITAQSLRALPGDKYDARTFPEMLKAYTEPAADKTIKADAWGVFISGYAPIHDLSGQAVAILGVDVDAGKMLELQKKVSFSGLLAGATFFVLLISLFGIFILRSPNTV
jgi:methyl-accepting chemotaxis protein